MDGSAEINDISGAIIGAAIKVHSRLGPGLLEHAYRRCLEYELKRAELKVECELSVPLEYDDLIIPGAYRIDLLVEGIVIVEVKAIEAISPVHHSQVLTYLKLSRKPLGLLVNFNVTRVIDGTKRIVNNLH